MYVLLHNSPEDITLIIFKISTENYYYYSIKLLHIDAFQVIHYGFLWNSHNCRSSEFEINWIDLSTVMSCDTVQTIALRAGWLRAVDWVLPVKYDRKHESYPRNDCVEHQWGSHGRQCQQLPRGRSSTTSGTTFLSSIEQLSSFMTLTTADSVLGCCK